MQTHMMRHKSSRKTLRSTKKTRENSFVVLCERKFPSAGTLVPNPLSAAPKTCADCTKCHRNSPLLLLFINTFSEHLQQTLQRRNDFFEWQFSGFNLPVLLRQFAVALQIMHRIQIQRTKKNFIHACRAGCQLC